jgi:hypothetical protein
VAHCFEAPALHQCLIERFGMNVATSGPEALQVFVDSEAGHRGKMAGESRIRAG